MDISSNNINDEDLEDLPDLIPLENTSPAASPFFANLLSQFEQQIPYIFPMNTISQSGQMPILSPIGRRYYRRITHNSIINTQSWLQDGSGSFVSANTPPSPPTTSPPPLLAVFPQPMFTTQTFTNNNTATWNLSSVMEQSFQDKPRYKQVISDEGEEQIKYKKYTKEDDINAICAITREEFSIGDKIAILPCDHVFCKEAINKWLQTKKAECPICRFKLASKEVKEEECETDVNEYTRTIPRPQQMRQMIYDLITNSIDAEEDEAIQRAIIASMQEIN